MNNNPIKTPTTYLGLTAAVLSVTLASYASGTHFDIDESDLLFDLTTIPYASSWDESDEEIDAPMCTPDNETVDSIEHSNCQSPLEYFFDGDKIEWRQP